jgi:phosphoglycolate phosphatase-like HAD superfamily hydrolase
LEVAADIRDLFSDLRVYIRSGEDYVLIHELIEKKTRIGSQMEFDAQLKTAGRRKMQCFQDLFYRARGTFLKNDREGWLKLNHLYPHIQKRLPVWAESPSFYILSSKKAEYIVEILTRNQIRIDSSRVLYTEGKSKLDILHKLINDNESSQAFFVDDQIDHLIGPAVARLEVALASWGYVKEEWLVQKQIPVIEPDQLVQIVDRIVENKPDFTL